jgi:hypothetical protein
MRHTGVLIVCFFFLAACSIPSLKTYTKEAIGTPISRKIEIMSKPNSWATSIGWKEKTYKLDNGNWVYVEPDRPGCFIHWEVNPEGIIVGYHFEGRCY